MGRGGRSSPRPSTDHTIQFDSGGGLDVGTCSGSPTGSTPSSMKPVMISPPLKVALPPLVRRPAKPKPSTPRTTPPVLLAPWVPLVPTSLTEPQLGLGAAQSKANLPFAASCAGSRYSNDFSVSCRADWDDNHPANLNRRVHAKDYTVSSLCSPAVDLLEYHQLDRCASDPAGRGVGSSNVGRCRRRKTCLSFCRPGYAKRQHGNQRGRRAHWLVSVRGSRLGRCAGCALRRKLDRNAGCIGFAPTHGGDMSITVLSLDDSVCPELLGALPQFPIDFFL